MFKKFIFLSSSFEFTTSLKIVEILWKFSSAKNWYFAI